MPISFEEQITYLAAQGAVFIYIFLFLSALIENIFPPWPSDTLTVTGAYLALLGKLSLSAVMVVAVLGGFCGAFILYYLGKTKGRAFFIKPGRKYFGKSDLNKVERWMERYGNLVLIGARFLAGVRSLVAIAAGIGNIEKYRFSFLTLSGFIIWNGVLVGAVYLLRESMRDFGGILSSYSRIILIILAAFITYYLLKRYIKFRKGDR